MSECTSCTNNSDKNSFFCNHCGKIQEIKLGGNVSFFSIFGIKPSIDIDKEMLDRNYSELIKLIHPDKFINSTEDEKLIAEVNTATINKAYSILSSDISICEYILNETNIQKISEVIDDEDNFLSEEIDLHEKLIGIKSINECTNFRNKLTGLYNMKLLNLRGSLLKKRWIDGNKALYKMKFIQNLLKILEKKAYMLEIDEKTLKK